MFKLKKEKKENVIKNKNHEHKAIIQRTQNDYDCCAYDINNQFVKSVSDNEIIWKKKSFSFIKFSNEEFSNTQH